jgi:hypothetical protein
MMRRLDMLGRFEVDHRGAGVDAAAIGSECIVPFFDDAQSDRDGFLADLRALVEGDTGGFATYGASRLVFELIGHDCRTPDALALIDGGIAFKRARGLPSAMLTGYEMQRWHEVNGLGSW